MHFVGAFLPWAFCVLWQSMQVPAGGVVEPVSATSVKSGDGCKRGKRPPGSCVAPAQGIVLALFVPVGWMESPSPALACKNPVCTPFRISF